MVLVKSGLLIVWDICKIAYFKYFSASSKLPALLGFQTFRLSVLNIPTNNNDHQNGPKMVHNNKRGVLGSRGKVK